MLSPKKLKKPLGKKLKKLNRGRKIIFRKGERYE